MINSRITCVANSRPTRGKKTTVRRHGSSMKMQATFGWAGSFSLQKVSSVALTLWVAMLCNPSLALGQESSPTQAVEDSLPVTTSPMPGERAMAEMAEQVARQTAEIAALRRQMEQRFREEEDARKLFETKADEKAKAVVEATLKESPRVAGSDGLTLSGFFETDMYVKQNSEDQLNTATGAPLNDDRFTIRRARLRGTIDRRYLAAILELDANTTNGPQVRPMNMEATIKLPGDPLPYIAATVGIFKIPFGFEIGQADYERLFAERSNLERALFPGEYDLGARVSGAWRFVRYVLAVQNGEPMGESTFPSRDPNAAKDVVGRLGVASPLGGGVSLQGGFSCLAGKGLHKGTAPTKPTTTWQDRNENGRIDPNEVIPVPGTSGLPSQNFSRNAIGADLLVSVTTAMLGKTTAYGEVTWAKNLDRGLVVADPYGPLGRDMREMGYYLALVQDFGEHVQAGIRYDRYDPDRDSTDRIATTVLLSSQAVSTFGVAVAGRWKIGGLTNRLLLQYDINRNHFGRDQAGLPTNLASNTFTMRAEAVF
jgi:hypothetical protein